MGIIMKFLAGGKAWLLFAAGIAIAILGGMFKAFNAGKNRERRKQQEAKLKAIKAAGWVEREFDMKADSEIDREAGRWTKR